MAIVWVVSNAGHDYEAAKDKGEIRFLFEGKVNVFASDLLVKETAQKLKEATEEDYLCLSGTALANCIAYAYFLKKFGRVNVLLFSFKNNGYELRTVREHKEE